MHDVDRTDYAEEIVKEADRSGGAPEDPCFKWLFGAPAAKRIHATALVVGRFLPRVREGDAQWAEMFLRNPCDWVAKEGRASAFLAHEERGMERRAEWEFDMAIHALLLAVAALDIRFVSATSCAAAVSHTVWAFGMDETEAEWEGVAERVADGREAPHGRGEELQCDWDERVDAAVPTARREWEIVARTMSRCVGPVRRADARVERMLDVWRSTGYCLMLEYASRRDPSIF